MLTILVIGYKGKKPTGLYCGLDGIEATKEADKAFASGDFDDVRIWKGSSPGSRVVPAPVPHPKPKSAPPAKAAAPTKPSTPAPTDPQAGENKQTETEQNENS